jgi:hypothetical protein
VARDLGVLDRRPPIIDEHEKPCDINDLTCFHPFVRSKRTIPSTDAAIRRWTQEGALPLPLPGPPYSEREAEVGSPSRTVLIVPSKSVILLNSRAWRKRRSARRLRTARSRLSEVSGPPLRAGRRRFGNIPRPRPIADHRRATMPRLIFSVAVGLGMIFAGAG